MLLHQHDSIEGTGALRCFSHLGEVAAEQPAKRVWEFPKIGDPNIVP